MYIYFKFISGRPSELQGRHKIRVGLAETQVSIFRPNHLKTLSHLHFVNSHFKLSGFEDLDNT